MHDQVAPTQRQGRLHRIGQARHEGVSLLDHQPVHHGFDGMLLVLCQLLNVGELQDRAVDPHPRIALAAQRVQPLPVFALAVLHQRRQKQDAGAGGQGQDLLHHGLGIAPAHLAVAVDAVLVADACEKHPQIVVNLGNGPYGGARIARGRLLIDGDGRRQTPDHVVPRLFHLADELAGIGGQRFHIPPLPLGEDGVEGQARFARTGYPGHHDQPFLGQIHVDVPQVVLSRPPDLDRVQLRLGAGLEHASRHLNPGFSASGHGHPFTFRHLRALFSPFGHGFQIKIRSPGGGPAIDPRLPA
jgi:hypothetical protein